jgi:hypothetical protein
MPLLSAVITGLLSLAGVYLANRKSAALMAYRMEQLEKKVDKHNQVVERTYRLEGRLDEAEHDIRDIKGRIA